MLWNVGSRGGHLDPQVIRDPEFIQWEGYMLWDVGSRVGAQE